MFFNVNAQHTVNGLDVCTLKNTTNEVEDHCAKRKQDTY